MDEIIKLPYFSLSQVSQFYSSRQVILVKISRMLKNKTIYKIREWFYVHKEFVNELKISNILNSYIEFLASNLVYSPSYISLEYVLYENNILTENVYSITCVSTKKTAKFENDFWKYTYKSIKKSFFWDYEIIKKDWFIIYKASKEKALFDYFYFKSDIVFNIDYFEELRLNQKNINLNKFEKLVKKYSSVKMMTVFNFIKQLKWL